MIDLIERNVEKAAIYSKIGREETRKAVTYKRGIIKVRGSTLVPRLIFPGFYHLISLGTRLDVLTLVCIRHI